jgi:hypothetical protein
MTPDEIVDLLTVAAAFDQRTVGEGDAMAWHAVLGDLDYADAQQAVLGYYADNRQRIMPADVRQRVKAMRRDRLAREIVPDPPAEPGPYREALRAGIRQIADGHAVHLAIAGPVREDPPPEEFTEARAKLGPALPGRNQGPLGLQDLARQQAAESRAARLARGVPDEAGETG